MSPLLVKYSETPYVVVTKQHELSQLDIRGNIRSYSHRTTDSIRSMASQHSNSDDIFNDTTPILSNTIITHHHSIPQVTRHYLGYKDLHRTLDSTKLCDRHHFLKTMANMDYHHQMLFFRINQLGNSTLAKAVQQDLDRMQDQIQSLDHFTCQMDLFNRSLVAVKSAHRQLEFASPRLFLVLPHEVESWDDHDRSTHRFRLYFLCDFNYRDSAQSPLQFSSTSTISPQHVHLVDHRGYDLERPHEFFHLYGAYALTMLEMVHHGFAHDIFSVPPLATFHILDSPGVTPPLTRHNLTRTNFRPLVHRAIAYLRHLLPGGGSQWTTWLSVEETRHLRSFLGRTDRFDYGMGGLCRTAYKAEAVWLCQGHAHTQARMFQFREFVQRHRGVSDLQLGRLSLRIGTEQQVQELVAALKTRCVHDVAVRFELEPRTEALAKFVEDVAESGVRVLQLDGVVARIHPQTRMWRREDTFMDAVTDTGLELVTLLNYPCQGVQSVYLQLLKGSRYRLQAEMATTATATALSSSSRLDISWEKLFMDLRQFEKVVLMSKNMSSSSSSSPSPRLAPNEFSIILDILSRQLCDHGAGTAALTSVDIFDEGSSSWQARIGIYQGVVQGVTEAFLTNGFLRPEILEYGRLRRLLVQAQDQSVVPYLYELMERNARLETIEMDMQESLLFARVAEVCTRWQDQREQLMVKVFDNVEEQDDRELLTIVIRRQDSKDDQDQDQDQDQAGPEYGGPIVTDVLYWNCDHVPHVMQDGDVALLDLVSQNFPTVLTSFTLDVSKMTAQGLSMMQRVLQRSSLEILHVRCFPIAPEHRDHVGSVLRAVQWSTIKGLTLSGSHIDDWLDVWVSDGDLFEVSAGQGLKLVSIEIKGTGSEDQTLSHASALAIHRLVYECPLLVVLWLDKFVLPSDSDWDLILSAVDVAVLVTLGLPDGNMYCQQLLDQVAKQWEAAGLMWSKIVDDDDEEEEEEEEEEETIEEYCAPVEERENLKRKLSQGSEQM
ncbi:hypothetical protein BG003_003735 [Podila horticola]|nr:hypothetical protein BG003_003735 [Podila horticola]